MSRGRNRRLALALAALAVGSAVNSLLGPLGTGVVIHPFSETFVKQTISLEPVSTASPVSTHGTLPPSSERTT